MGQYFGNVQPVGAGNAFLQSFRQSLAQAKQDALLRRSVQMQDEDRRTATTMQALQLHEQYPGTTLLPTSFRDVGPGTLPNPVDNLQVGKVEPGQPLPVSSGAGMEFGPGYVTDLGERQRVLADRLQQSLASTYAGAQAQAAGKAAGDPLAGDVQRSTINKNNAQAAKDSRIPTTTVNTTQGIFRLNGDTPTPVTYNGSVLQPPSSQAPDRSLTLVADPKNPTGPGIYVPRAQAVGQHAPAGAGAGKVTGLGSGGITGVGRTIASVNSMHLAHDQMTAFENDPTLRNHYGAAKDFETKIAGNFDSHGMIDGVAMSNALSDLNKNDPELANYFQNSYLWALEEANLSGRPSDFRTRLDHFVSSLKPNMSPQALRSMQTGRLERLNGYDQMMPALRSVLKGIAGNDTSSVVPNARKQTAPADTTGNPWSP